MLPRLNTSLRPFAAWLAIVSAHSLIIAPHAHGDTSAQEQFFENTIRPLLVQHCVECHGPKKQESGLRLDTRKGFLQGGDLGSLVVKGSAEDSLLIQAVLRQDGLEMPPETPLEPQQVAALVEWVRAGAQWPDTGDEEAPATDIRSGPITAEERAFWSFQPVRRPSVPQVSDDAWCYNDIDRFILSQLQHNSLPPTHDAPPRKLIRRAFLDLHGLPPTPEQTNTYLSTDPDQRVASLVTDLLQQPQYGERWGRHWLDVVRYADTAGETADYPVPLAWKYRNYVIDSFNADKPYDQFVREQIAGDIIAQTDPERWAELVTATGYLAVSRRFGFGIEEFQYLTIQDAIDTTGQAVLGLSLGCARCHSHKYDPVSAEDYYAWYGIFDSTQFALSGDEKSKVQRDLVPLVPPQEVQRLTEHNAALTKELTDRLATLQTELIELEKQVGLSGPLSGDMEDYPLAGQLADPWDSRGGEIATVAQSPFNNVNVSGTRGLRTRNDAGNNGCGCKVPARTADTHEHVYLNLDFRNVSEANPATGTSRIYVGQGPGISPAAVCHIYQSAFHVINGTALQKICDVEPGQWYNLQLTLNLKTRRFSGTLTSQNRKDSFSDIAFHDGWNGTVDAIFVDGHGLAFGVRPVQDFDNFTLRNTPLLRPEQSVDEGSPELKQARQRVRELGQQISDIKNQQAQLAALPYELAYAVKEGTPHNTPVHRRGDPLKPAETPVPRRQLEILGGQPVSNADQSSGRMDLANWLTAADNPLTARVMVNRIWQYHFGKAIVDTPNDFGRRGAEPTHPELLDWLAVEFMESGWSIKHMHQLIMSSHTWQLSSLTSPTLSPKDEQQRTDSFGRFQPRRLDAESIRDSILAVSGQLDRTPGTSHPFPDPASWNFTQHGPFYAVYPTNKRSVYVMRQRLQAHPFFKLFDAADPNVSTAKRSRTTTPTQALFLLNNPLVHENAQALARQVITQHTENSDRMHRLYETVYSRLPDDSELQSGLQFLESYRSRLSGDADVDQQSWAALCRTLLVSNEFLYLY